MNRIKINYLEGQALKFVSFDTDEHPSNVLENIGKAAALGSLYTVWNEGRHTVSFAGRCIQTVEIQPVEATS